MVDAVGEKGLVDRCEDSGIRKEGRVLIHDTHFPTECLLGGHQGVPDVGVVSYDTSLVAVFRHDLRDDEVSVGFGGGDCVDQCVQPALILTVGADLEQDDVRIVGSEPVQDVGVEEARGLASISAVAVLADVAEIERGLVGAPVRRVSGNARPWLGRSADVEEVVARIGQQGVKPTAVAEFEGMIRPRRVIGVAGSDGISHAHDAQRDGSGEEIPCGVIADPRKGVSGNVGDGSGGNSDCVVRGGGQIDARIDS